MWCGSFALMDIQDHKFTLYFVFSTILSRCGQAFPWKGLDSISHFAGHSIFVISIQPCCKGNHSKGKEIMSMANEYG